MHTDHLVVGAGVAGLACARELKNAGHNVIVIDKAHCVGGRCATRRVEGQPIDLGPAFLQGSNPHFIDLLQSIPEVTLLPWPQRRHGEGKPCQHEAFLPTETRLAIAEGLDAFPQFMARNLDVRLQRGMTELTLEQDVFGVSLAGGETLRTASLVLTMPVAQALTFVWPLVGHSQELEAVATLLDLVPSLPCLTVMAGYELATPAPPWDVYYPDQSDGLMMVSHDSAKRIEPRFRTLVLQATPRWSRAHLDEAPALWSSALLSELGALVGDWVAAPKWTHPHVWRHSRVDLGNELTGPVRITLPGGASLGLAGDVFAPAGGVEAAWNAGRTLACRLLEEDGGNE